MRAARRRATRTADRSGATPPPSLSRSSLPPSMSTLTQRACRAARAARCCCVRAACACWPPRSPTTTPMTTPMAAWRCAWRCSNRRVTALSARAIRSHAAPAQSIPGDVTGDNDVGDDGRDHDDTNVGLAIGGGCVLLRSHRSQCARTLTGDNDVLSDADNTTRFDNARDRCSVVHYATTKHTCAYEIPVCALTAAAVVVVAPVAATTARVVAAPTPTPIASQCRRSCAAARAASRSPHSRP